MTTALECQFTFSLIVKLRLIFAKVCLKLYSILREGTVLFIYTQSSHGAGGRVQVRGALLHPVRLGEVVSAGQ